MLRQQLSAADRAKPSPRNAGLPVVRHSRSDPPDPSWSCWAGIALARTQAHRRALQASGHHAPACTLSSCKSCKDRTDKRALYADPPQDLGDLPKPANSAVQQAKTVAAARPSVKLTGPRPARVFKVPLNVKALIESDDEVSQPCSVCSSAVILAVRLLDYIGSCTVQTLGMQDEKPLKVAKRTVGAGIRSALPPPQHSAPAEHKVWQAAECLRQRRAHSSTQGSRQRYITCTGVYSPG